MRNSSKDLSVFEFKTDEVNEAGDKLTKYQFLEAFTTGCHHLKTPDVSVLAPVDLHEVDSPERSTRNLVSTEEISELDDVKDLPVNLVSNEEESCTSLSEASSTSGHPECLVYKYYQSTFAEDDNKNAVVVCPDYVIYRDHFFVESQLTFCSDCIKIVCSETYLTDEKLIVVCDIADIIRICSQWSTSVDALLFKFWIRTNAGPEKFIASVADDLWLGIEHKIKSLAERYKDIWDTLPDNNYALEDEMSGTHMSFSKRYFTAIMEPFEDVIYPKGDPDAISISKRDIELLEPDTFINDTIIDFYIKYLQDKVQPSEKSRFHFFNCFFFRKLADLDKDPGSISEGKAAYQRVRKWTRKLNIFGKDYIFIPVNFNLHWSLLIICHPGEIITFKDEDLKNSPKVPCILHMDSFRGNHKGLEKLIQSYLLEEWKGRHSEFPDDIASRFTNLRFVHLELPQQENTTDCGLFLLHYVELFLGEAPLCFNPTKIYSFSNFLTADWFPPSEASFKRFHIRGLLYDILRDSSQKLTSSNEDFPSLSDVANDTDQAMKFFSVQNSPSNPCNKQEELVWRELLDPGSSSTLPNTAQDDSFVQTASFMSSPVTHPLVGHEDPNVEAAEDLDRECEADSAEQMVPIGSLNIQVYSTSFCEISSFSEQVKEGVADSLSTSSNDELKNSNERHEAKEITSPTVDECPFVPDTPNTSNQQQEDYGTNSQEIVTTNIEEAEKHIDPHVHCAATDDRYGDMSETESRKAEHCPKREETCGIQDFYLVEDVGGGDKEMSGYEEAGDVADSQDDNIMKERSEEDLPCPRDLVVTEVILSDSDVTPAKRSKISGSVQRISKRQKLEHDSIQCRITRRSLRKMDA